MSVCSYKVVIVEYYHAPYYKLLIKKKCITSFLLPLSCMIVPIENIVNTLEPTSKNFESQTMKSKKLQSKKFAFDSRVGLFIVRVRVYKLNVMGTVSKSLSVPLLLSSLRNVASDSFMFNMDYVERVV